MALNQTPQPQAGPLTAKTITGGRTIVSSDALGGAVVGIFDSITINEGLTLEDIHTLGKFGPQEIVATAYNAVTVNCSGFRVYGSGLKALGQFPTLQDLVNLGTLTLTVQDRQNPSGAPLQTIISCVPETNNVNYNARASSKVNITYRGTALTDESTVGDAELGATTYP
jgi:hypothetical protein